MCWSYKDRMLDEERRAEDVTPRVVAEPEHVEPAHVPEPVEEREQEREPALV